MGKTRTQEEKLQARIEQLESRLAEAEETIRAIREGEVDAFAIETATGTQIFTLKGADMPYRVMVETMNEAAVMLTPDGTILYCNLRFGEMVKTPLESIIGNSIYGFILPQGKNLLERLIKGGSSIRNSEGIDIQSAEGTSIPVLISVSEIHDGTTFSICLILTDITYLRMVQQDLQKSRDELERQLNKRTYILR
ncbi:MAG: PAS domain-containing protein [Deltaproteobacteria bacterium]|nr:PAS domain-containing protein [Deltaproteobacteria bacterium]